MLFVPSSHIEIQRFPHGIQGKVILAPLQEGAFMKSLEPELAERGIVPKMGEEQSQRKKAILNKLAFSALAEGQHPAQIEARTHMRTSRVDLLDPVSSAEKRDKVTGPLKRVPNENPNIQERLIDMPHAPAAIYYRDNAMRRMAKVGVKLWEMQQAA